MRKDATIRYLGRNTIRQCAATLGLAREKVGPRSARPVAPRPPALSLLALRRRCRPSRDHSCLCLATRIESSDPFCYLVTSVPHPSEPFRDQSHLSHNVARGDT